MDAELRDWYLSTLGIVQYRPWSPPELVVAADSELGDSELGHAQDIEKKSKVISIDQETATQREPKTAAVPQSLKDLVADVVDQSVVSSAETGVKPVLDSTQTDSTPEETTAFRLACWRPSEDLLVLDSWPIGQGADNRRSQLLANILKSIGRRPATLMQPEFIDWPLGPEKSLLAAQDHLSMFIQGRYEQQAFSWVLAMGEDVHSCLTSAELASEKSLSRLPLACGAEALFTYSLSEMIATPAYKKDVWAVIRFLVL
ncbi:MAG: hypothetical protein KUG71_13650 [Porticoccaceae bacterium]|nr:hypothetical protein [Porticoccaceae bacterium]